MKKIFIAIVMSLVLLTPITLSKEDFIQKQEIVSVASLQKEMVTSPQKEEIKIYSTSILNVRREPSLSAEVVALIPKNTELTFKENVNESWIKIEINETEYFVNSNYISETAPIVENIIYVLQIENHDEIYFVNHLNQEVDNPNLINLGKFKLTAYCSCNKCCGGWASKRDKDAYGKDIVQGSTGERLYEKLSIAVDPQVIPYHSEVSIDGHTYVAHDCGGAIDGNRIDIYFEDHSTALEFGVQYKEIFLWKY